MESYQNAASGQVRARDARAARARSSAGRACASSTCATSTRTRVRTSSSAAPLRRPSASGLQRREQVLVLLNRRGYATAVFCRQCGDTFECPNCSVSLTVHTRARDGMDGARCHYCNYSMTRAEGVPASARRRTSSTPGSAPSGSKQHLRDRFPEARIGRVDRDSVRRKGALTRILSQLRRAASSTSSSARR